jgi:hypothetical protein
MGFVSRADLRVRNAARSARIAAIKADLVARLGLTEADAVSVNEIACAEACCPDRETLVLVMREGEPTRAYRIARPLETVMADDLAGVQAEDARSGFTLEDRSGSARHPSKA